MYLIINPGSASKKYALYENGSEIFKAHLETEGGNLISTTVVGDREKTEKISAEQYKNSVNYILRLLIDARLIGSANDIGSIGVRIVAPGSYFLSNRVIDKEFLAKLKESEQKAPLHIRPELLEIKQILEIMPGIPLAGISDSAFHKTMPIPARLYGLPEETAVEFEIYRYGYHGISAQSLVPKIKNTFGEGAKRTIICHLGSGSSVIAVKDGQSVDASMGFTPLEGLVMSTRIGNIDAGAVIYLAKNAGLAPNELEEFFNSKCGLLGIGGSDDIRELLKLEKAGNKEAKNALDVFAYAVKKYIGAYMATLGGLDLLIFTATVGERSFIMRSRICAGLEELGIVLDEDKNKAVISADGLISADGSKVKIAVLTTDEMGEMARQTKELMA